MRLKILHRYILRQFLANLALGVVIFTFVLLLDHLFELVDLLINKGVGLWLTLKLLFLLLPSSLSLTLPMSYLLAALLTFGQLSETNELTAARASGISMGRLIAAPVTTAVLAVLFLIPFNTVWAPRAHGQFRVIYLQVLQRNPLIHIDPKTFANVGDYHLYVEKKTRKAPQLHGITIYKTPAQGAPLRIFAEDGQAVVDSGQGLTLALQRGHIEQIDPKRPDRWFFTAFNTYVLVIPFEGAKPGSTRALEEMTNHELNQEADDLAAKHLPHPIYTSEIHLRWALAVVPLLFVMLGIPLAIQMQRGGRSIGFGLSLLIVLAYYILTMGGLAISQRGVWPAAISVWIGNIILTLTGIGLILRLMRR